MTIVGKLTEDSATKAENIIRFRIPLSLTLKQN